MPRKRSSVHGADSPDYTRQRQQQQADRAIERQRQAQQQQPLLPNAASAVARLQREFIVQSRFLAAPPPQDTAKFRKGLQPVWRESPENYVYWWGAGGGLGLGEEEQPVAGGWRAEPRVDTWWGEGRRTRCGADPSTGAALSEAGSHLPTLAQGRSLMASQSLPVLALKQVAPSIERARAAAARSRLAHLTPDADLRQSSRGSAGFGDGDDDRWDERSYQDGASSRQSSRGGGLSSRQLRRADRLSRVGGQREFDAPSRTAPMQQQAAPSSQACEAKPVATNSYGRYDVAL